MMDNGVSEYTKEKSHTEMIIKTEMEEAAQTATYVEVEVDLEWIKEGLVPLVKTEPELSVEEEVLEDNCKETMEHGASDRVKERLHTEMTIKTELEEEAETSSFVEIEVNMDCVKEEPRVVELEKREPGVSVHEEVLGNTWQADTNFQLSNKTNQSEQRVQSYSCDKCARTFTSKDSFRKHCRYAHLTESYTCTECNKAFTRKYYLNRHTSNVHSKQKYECAVCKKICKSKEALHTHVSRVHRHVPAGSEPRNYICDYCRKTFTIKASIQNHITGVHANRSHKCSQCNKHFKCERYLTSHTANVHAGAQVCNVCGKSVRPSHLKQHIRTMHGDKQSKLCEEPMKSIQCLRQHLNDLHGQPSADHLRSNEVTQTEQQSVTQLYRCDPCLKSYKYKFNLTRHHKRVHGDESHRCSECNKEFKSKDYLVAHVRCTHRKQQVPTEAYEQSNQAPSRPVAGLYDHMSLGPHVELYACDYCQKAFRRKQAVRQHIERVHGPRVHPCRKCDKIFKCKEHLQQHNKYVHGSAQQESETCTTVYKDKDALTAHFKCAHGSEECRLENKCSLCTKMFEGRENLRTYAEWGLTADEMCAAAPSTSTRLHNVVVIKEEPTHDDLELGPIVFQHMDSNYRPYKEEPQRE